MTVDPAGQVLAASRTWRKADIRQEELAIKPFARARAEAERQLKNLDAY